MMQDMMGGTMGWAMGAAGLLAILALVLLIATLAIISFSVTEAVRAATARISQNRA